MKTNLLIFIIVITFLNGCALFYNPYKADIQKYEFSSANGKQLKEYLKGEKITIGETILARVCLIDDHIYVQKVYYQGVHDEEGVELLIPFQNGLKLEVSNKEITTQIPIELLTDEWQYLHELKKKKSPLR